jgi:4-amino-4-deoxy-L-arabinose transferase-like glycosyltransferase
MVRSGNWLVPTLDTLPFFHKPPLFYWLTASAIATFGNHEWAARLPGLLAATAAAVGLFGFLRRWSSEAIAIAALVILATTPFFFGAAQFANLDMLVAACITGTILCAADVVLALKQQQGSRRLQLAGAYTFAALGVLAKGLIAVVIPALVIGIWLVLTQEARLMLRLLWLPGVALFAGIALPWFVFMQVRYPDFLEYIFIHHHVERFLTAQFNGKQAVWLYLPFFFAVTLPWSAVLPWAVRNRRESGVAHDLHLLLWIWLATTLIFFSIPRSKLLGYVLPATPALAALVAQAIVSRANAWLGRRTNVIATGLVTAAICVGGVVADAVQRGDGIGQLAAEIRAKMRPGDRLLAISRYPYSVPFYLRSSEPISVVDDWDEPTVQRRDNWRRELYEAAKFDPARGHDLLLPSSQLGAALCAGRTWIFASERELDLLAGLQPILRKKADVVWLAEASERSCPAQSR